MRIPRETIPDAIALAGALLVAAGVLLMAGPGPALVVVGLVAITVAIALEVGRR